VVGALPSALGLQTLAAVIDAKRNYCDISFLPEDPRCYADAARAAGVTVVYDCGLAPGMSNMFAGYAAAELDTCERVDLYVGALPVERHWPYQYKAGFSPLDVIEEYTRPARLIEGGEQIVKPALSDTELVDVPGVGTLEAFNTDGLRSLVDTVRAPWMREKTLRYPGHAEVMRLLRETGFLSRDPVDLNGQMIRPLELTAALLFPKWTFQPGEADLTVLQARIEGRRGPERVRYVWDLLDHHDAKNDTRSLSRTTAFPAAVMTRWLATGHYRNPGVHPPEVPARVPGLLNEMLSELAKRGVRYSARVEPLARPA
jgi:lysine 6-dehydrogenase